MPKLPPEGDIEACMAAGRARQTRAMAAAEATPSKPPTQSGTKGTEETTSDKVVPPRTPLQVVAHAILEIVTKQKIKGATKEQFEGVLTFVKETEEPEAKKMLTQGYLAEVGALRKSVNADLRNMYSALVKQLNGIQETANEALTVADRTYKDVTAIKDATKDLENKVGNVSDAANKIAVTTETYCDAVLKSPAQHNKANTDPKILGDMDRKAKQVLVQIFDTEGNDTLAKSLTELKERANEALKVMTDSDKPKDAKVEAVMKTRNKSILLMFNSKEAAEWVRTLTNECYYADNFSKGLHILERRYNLIVPQVPVTFAPTEKEQLHKLEEANGLQKLTIAKARWIKPEGRRRPNQTHAYAIISTNSAEAANLLIRDGLNIYRIRVRPTKQKQKPTQCMKCRKWGHFASECTEESDTCGTCGRSHRTSTCKNKSKRYCVSCKDHTHTSWDRSCLEFARRCAIIDERNAENEMPYFPTEQDWTLTVRPNRIPLDVHFPQKFTINSLPHAGKKGPNETPRPPWAKKNEYSRELHNCWQKAGGALEQSGNLNLIPLNRTREEGEYPAADKLEYLSEVEGTRQNPSATDEENNTNMSGWI